MTIFSLRPREQGVETIKETKTIFENEARVHIAIISNFPRQEHRNVYRMVLKGDITFLSKKINTFVWRNFDTTTRAPHSTREVRI